MRLLLLVGIYLSSFLSFSFSSFLVVLASQTSQAEASNLRGRKLRVATPPINLLVPYTPPDEDKVNPCKKGYVPKQSDRIVNAVKFSIDDCVFNFRPIKERWAPVP